MTKKELRKIYLNKRRSLSEENFRQLNDRLCDNFFANIDVGKIDRATGLAMAEASMTASSPAAGLTVGKSDFHSLVWKKKSTASTKKMFHSI